MQNWSTIPVELLYMVTTYCGRDCTQVKWMFTNKYWFTFYLSQVYKTVTTSLGDEPVINKILNSTFDVGKHVKCVNLSDIQRPADLNEFEVHTDILGKIMKKTPNVIEVNLSSRNQTQFNEDWIYFSMVLVSVNCWKLQFISNLGNDPIVCAAYYYTCAYHSRHTLKRLERLSVFGLSDLYLLKDFTALEILEVHKNLISGLTDIEKFLQHTPILKELIVRFATNCVYQPIKRENAVYSNLKKLRLYNFNPQYNDELLTLVEEFPALESLHIFCETNKIFLSYIDDSSTIDKFFDRINLIPEYKIVMTGEIQEIRFSEPWLKSFENGKDIQLLHSYSKEGNQNHLNFNSTIVATFYGGSTQSTPLLEHAMKSPQFQPKIIEKWELLESQKIPCFTVSGASSGLSIYFEHIIAKERPYLKQITILNCTFEDYAPRKNVTFVPRHMNRIIFYNCRLDLLLLKSTLSEFKSLDYVEFNGCTFRADANMPSPSIDMSNTDVTSMKMVNFRKMLSIHTYNDKVQAVITISVYFAALRLFRYFSAVENNLFQTTKNTCKLFRSKFNNNEAVLLDIRVKSLQELSLKLTDASKLQNISFRLQES